MVAMIAVYNRQMRSQFVCPHTVPSKLDRTHLALEARLLRELRALRRGDGRERREPLEAGRHVRLCHLSFTSRSSCSSCVLV